MKKLIAFGLIIYGLHFIANNDSIQNWATEQQEIALEKERSKVSSFILPNTSVGYELPDSYEFIDNTNHVPHPVYDSYNFIGGAMKDEKNLISVYYKKSETDERLTDQENEDILKYTLAVGYDMVYGSNITKTSTKKVAGLKMTYIELENKNTDQKMYLYSYVSGANIYEYYVVASNFINHSQLINGFYEIIE